MKTKRIILFLAAAALFTGCFKDVSYKTTYVFKPLEQEKSGDPTNGANLEQKASSSPQR